MPAAASGAMSSRAFSRNWREVMMCFSPASWAHCSMTGMPVEKLSIAGTFCAAQRLSSTMGWALTLGSRIPMCSPAGPPRRRRHSAANTSAPTISRR